MRSEYSIKRQSYKSVSGMALSWPKQVIEGGRDTLKKKKKTPTTFRRISQLWNNAHTLNLENGLLYLSSTISQFFYFIRCIVFDFIFYCVTVHTLYRPFAAGATWPKFYIMGYNLKNIRNGKSASKIAKWSSLRPLAFKSKFIWQFEFSNNLEDLYGKCCCAGEQGLVSNNFCHRNLLILFESADCHKISFNNDGGLRLSHFDILDMLFPFLAFVKL